MNIRKVVNGLEKPQGDTQSKSSVQRSCGYQAGVRFKDIQVVAHSISRPGMNNYWDLQGVDGLHGDYWVLLTHDYTFIVGVKAYQEEGS